MRHVYTTTVFLVRHGQTESNINGYYMGWTEEDLSKLGFRQAQQLASRLASQNIASVYSSPLKRTYNTAAILARQHGLEPTVSDEIIEIHLGDWQGLHRDEIKQTWPEIWRQSRTDPSAVRLPAGESFGEVTERAVRAFNSIVATNQGLQAVIVSHEVVIKVIIAHVLGTSNHIYRQFEIANASLSKVQVTAGKSLLVTLNDTAHLEELR
jgi:broad specificity phosphatase PhoE